MKVEIKTDDCDCKMQHVQTEEVHQKSELLPVLVSEQCQQKVTLGHQTRDAACTAFSWSFPLQVNQQYHQSYGNCLLLWDCETPLSVPSVSYSWT